MELRVLKYFLIVAREKNITRAANLLYVTQPTLSRQLMQLEKELGTKLFERGRHNISLTNEGMLLKRYAQEIVFLEEKILQDLSYDSTNITGKIVISCGETSGMDHIAKAISLFTKDYPFVNFEINTCNSDTTKEMIDKGIVDFGLLLEPVDISRYEFKKLPYCEQWGVLVKEDSLLAQKKYITPSDLVEQRIFLPNRDIIIHELTNWFGDEFDKLTTPFHYNLGYNLSWFVKNDAGIAICLNCIDQIKDLTFIPLYPALETNSILVWKKNQIQSPAAKLFLGYIKKCL